jgi:putative alpha-1,2-mannosidase
LTGIRLVDPFVGTGSGGDVAGQVDTFPGADMQFGVAVTPDSSQVYITNGGHRHTRPGSRGRQRP